MLNLVNNLCEILESWLIWNDSMDLVEDIYELIVKLPNSEKFGLTSQISRAVVSIPSNIAEGYAKDSQKDFVRFLKISLGSAFELETQVMICKRLSFITEKEGVTTIEKINLLQKRIQALVNYT